MTTDTTQTDTTPFALPFIGGVVLAVPCRVPQNMNSRYSMYLTYHSPPLLPSELGRAGLSAPMDVTRENFEAAATLLESLLPTCAFVAIDEEMTGITLDKASKPCLSDSPEARYKKMCRVAEEFMLMQVGICLFHATDDGGYVARPFNVYVFPAESSPRRMVMSTSTAHFHVSNKMDFNRWICEGVPFLDAGRHKVMRDKIQADADVRDQPAAAADDGRKPLVATRPADVAFVKEAMEGLLKWEAAGAGDVSAAATIVDADADQQKPPLAVSYELPACNGFLRRILHEQIGARCPQLSVESRETSDPRKKALVVLRLDSAAKAAHSAERLSKKLAEVDGKAGFLRIWQALGHAAKPLVGHNLLYDLMFLWTHFEGPLPETLAEFKRGLNAHLPSIWDTKQVYTAHFDDLPLCFFAHSSPTPHYSHMSPPHPHVPPHMSHMSHPSFSPNLPPLILSHVPSHSWRCRASSTRIRCSAHSTHRAPPPRRQYAARVDLRGIASYSPPPHTPTLKR